MPGIQKTDKEVYTMSLLGVITNIGIVIYMGYQLSQCLGPEQIAGLNTAQNPFILSFVAVLALFIAIKH